jgi:Arc/MetJ family transcription regulator
VRIDVPKTLIDVDVELLNRAKELLGTLTKKDTVNAALRELVRRDAAVQFVALIRAGALDAPPAVDQP